MSGIVGSRLNNRGSGLIGSLGTDGQVLTSSGAGKSAVFEAGAIDDNAVTLAKMAGLARGKLIYGDTSGDPAALAVGSANEVLTHDGTDFDWAAAGGGGKILQVQHAKIETNTTVTATSVTTTGVTDTITPSADTSKILVMMDVILGNYETAGVGTNAKAALYRDINGGGFSAIYRDEGNYHAGFDGGGLSGEISSSFPSQMIFVDSPNTTDACTYTYYMCPYGGTIGDSLNTGPSNQDSSVVLMEIDGS